MNTLSKRYTPSHSRSWNGDSRHLEELNPPPCVDSLRVQSALLSHLLPKYPPVPLVDRVAFAALITAGLFGLTYSCFM